MRQRNANPDLIIGVLEILGLQALISVLGYSAVQGSSSYHVAWIMHVPCNQGLENEASVAPQIGPVLLSLPDPYDLHGHDCSEGGIKFKVLKA